MSTETSTTKVPSPCLETRNPWAINDFKAVLTETRLTPQEVVLATDADEHLGVVVTNRRALGWASRFAGSAEHLLNVHESFASLRVRGTTASVRTTKRVLIFDSSSGLWRDESLPLN